MVRRLRAADGPRLRAPRPMSQETHAARWIGFRQPVLRVALRAAGQDASSYTWQAHERRAAGVGGGRVLDRAVVADRSRRQPRHPQVLRVARTGRARRSRIEEYYRWIFENSVPGLPGGGRARGADAARVHAQVRRVPRRRTSVYGTARDAARARRSVDGRRRVDPGHRTCVRQGRRGGRRRGRRPARCVGFPTPSRKLEFYSQDAQGLEVAGARACPTYIAEPRALAEDRPRRGRDRAAADVPAADADPHALAATPSGSTRSPTPTRSGSTRGRGAAAASRPATCSRSTTEIGHFVDRVWVTEAIRPGVVACSHHLGRWRLPRDAAASAGRPRWSTCRRSRPASWRMRQLDGVQALDERRPRLAARCGGRTPACTRT